jgi:hypothetical protein
MTEWPALENAPDEHKRKGRRDESVDTFECEGERLGDRKARNAIGGIGRPIQGKGAGKEVRAILHRLVEDQPVEFERKRDRGEEDDKTDDDLVPGAQLHTCIDRRLVTTGLRHQYTPGTMR